MVYLSLIISGISLIQMYKLNEFENVKLLNLRSNLKSMLAGNFPKSKIYWRLSTGTTTKTWFLIYIKILFKEKCFNMFDLIHWLRWSISRLMIKKTDDFVKNWPSNTNLCFEKHWFLIIFYDKKLRIFNIYLKN